MYKCYIPECSASLESQCRLQMAVYWKTQQSITKAEGWDFCTSKCQSQTCLINLLKIWPCLLHTSNCDVDSNSGVNGWFGEERGDCYLCGTGCTADTDPCLWGVRHTCSPHMERKCPSPGHCYTFASHKCLWMEKTMWRSLDLRKKKQNRKKILFRIKLI